MSAAQFRLSAETDAATVYFEVMPPMPVPRVGEDVFVGGEALGWWRVTGVFWHLPSFGAMEPTMEVRLRVEWSDVNQRSAPTWDEDLGWVRAPDEVNEYRPPSIADGTVSQGLIDGLRHLIDEYGQAGVTSTLAEMRAPDEVNGDET